MFSGTDVKTGTNLKSTSYTIDGTETYLVIYVDTSKTASSSVQSAYSLSGALPESDTVVEEIGADAVNTVEYEEEAPAYEEEAPAYEESAEPAEDTQSDDANA